MGFISFVPKKEDLGTAGDLVAVPDAFTANAIIQGSDWFRVFTVRNPDGTPIDMSEWIGEVPKCDFRDKSLFEGGVTTGFPQPTMSWLNGGIGGQLQLFIPRASTIGLAAGKYQGVYSIEAKHTASALVAGLFYGNFYISREITS